MSNENKIVKIETELCITLLNKYLKRRTYLLSQPEILKKDEEEVEILTSFADNLPLSLDSEINDGFAKMREFAKKIGKQS